MKGIDNAIFIGTLCLVVVVAVYLLGWCSHASKSGEYERKQIQTEIKHELSKKNKDRQRFKIKGTDIHITPREDGSGVIKIIEPIIAGASDQGYRKTWEGK